jgi:ketosteroid isomerase-like protein
MACLDHAPFRAAAIDNSANADGWNGQMASTKDVLDHHVKCFSEGDLEGILSDYAPDAVLFTPDGPLRGADAMRPFFQAMLAEFGKPGP